MTIMTLALVATIALSCDALHVQRHGENFWPFKGLFEYGETGQGACSTGEDCRRAGTNMGEKSIDRIPLRCCPVSVPGQTWTAPGCPEKLQYQGSLEEVTAQCVLPSRHYSNVSARCSCTRPSSCTANGRINGAWPYEPAHDGFKQWLIIGDSVSEGIVRHVRVLRTAQQAGIQVQHSAVNALNTAFGLHCIDEWLDDPGRWDLISFNFGIHDLSLNSERIEPQMYARNIRRIAKRIHIKAPQAAILFATTTPVAFECGQDLPCDKGMTLAGLATRRSKLHRPEDPKIYTDAAIKRLRFKHFKVSTVDLYRVITKICGENYETCPKDCKSKEDLQTTCIVHPGDVHFATRGYLLLAEAYTSAVVKALGIEPKQWGQWALSAEERIEAAVIELKAWNDARHL